MITVDTNSGEDAVFAALPDLEDGVVYRRQRLDVGDILVEGVTGVTGVVEGDDEKQEEPPRVCIERKTWADLCASICDGRLQEQKARMIADDRTRYVYAIEGGEVHAWDGFQRGMRHKAMWGALVKLQMRDQFAVVHTRGPEDTAALARYCLQQLREDGFRPGGGTKAVAGLQKRKRANLTDPSVVLRAMLTTVPGMSDARAGVVAERYPTVAGLVAASAQELASLACGNNRSLGPKLAQALKAVFAA